MLKYKLNGSIEPAQFGDLLPILSNRLPFLILDCDGTLVPICETLEEAVLHPSQLNLLNDVGRHLVGRVAIVSARGLSRLTHEFDPQVFTLAGNYGLEISYPSGQKFVHPKAVHARLLMIELAAEMAQLILNLPSLILDNHGYSLCLHFHRLPDDRLSDLHTFIHQLELGYSTLEFRRLNTSYEVVPSVNWDKSSALDHIATHLSLEVEDPLYIAFGDSEMDEPMFSWVNRRQGLSFSVGCRDSTAALGLMESPDDVFKFLDNLLVLHRPVN
jgi:trehalose-phosphatase